MIIFDHDVENEDARWKTFFREGDDDVPAMPCQKAGKQGHRRKAGPASFNACVARPVPPRR